MAQEKRKIVEVEEVISDLSGEVGSISSYDAAGLIRDIKKATKPGDPDRYMCLGMVATLQWDAKTSIEQHEKSIKLSDGNIAHWSNYLISLHRFGLTTDRSVELAATMLEMWPNSYESHEAASMVYMDRGDLKALKNIIEMADSHFKNDPQKMEHFNMMSERISIIEKSGLSEDEFSYLHKNLKQFLSDHHMGLTFEHYYMDNEGGGILEIELGDVNDPDKVLDLNDDFFEFMCKEGSDFGWIGKLSVNLTGRYNAN